jgi:hypothetical protein
MKQQQIKDLNKSIRYWARCIKEHNNGTCIQSAEWFEAASAELAANKKKLSVIQESGPVNW